MEPFLIYMRGERPFSVASSLFITKKLFVDLEEWELEVKITNKSHNINLNYLRTQLFRHDFSTHA